MKKLLAILVLGLILFVTQTNKSFAMEYGYGELKLSDYVVKGFVKFIKGDRNNSPYLFAVAIDGLAYTYWICPGGVEKCRGGSPKMVIKDCEKYSRKYGSGAKCAVFAHKRNIRWDNGINKKSKINSKWSDEEIIAKLGELGFLGGKKSTKVKKVKYKYESSITNSFSNEVYSGTSNNSLEEAKKNALDRCKIYEDKPELCGKVKKAEKKETKKIKKSSDNDDIVSQLESLKKLLDSEVITKEEFKKAKKKLLN